MSVRTVHILSSSTDTVPTTGDPIVTLFDEPQLFTRAYPARKLTPAEAKAFQLVHNFLSPQATDA